MAIWRFIVAIVLTAGLVATGVFVSGVVQATHNFSDVPTTAFYHNAVEWVFNRGITAGCAMGLYCPNDPVTRGTMAVFLQKEGQALTPIFLDTVASPGALDPDAVPTFCQTVDFAVTGYPRSAIIASQAFISPAGAMGFRMYNSVSTNGGVSWAAVNSFVQGQTAAASGEILSVNSNTHLDLAVGTTYRFGITIDRWSGTSDVTNSGCEMHVQIINRNGTSTPLMPATSPANALRP